MVSGIVFFSILTIMLKNGNMFLTRNNTPDEVQDKITALLFTIGLNAVCLVNCVACVIIGTRQEAEEARKKAELDLKR